MAQQQIHEELETTFLRYIHSRETREVHRCFELLINVYNDQLVAGLVEDRLKPCLNLYVEGPIKGGYRATQFARECFLIALRQLKQVSPVSSPLSFRDYVLSITNLAIETFQREQMPTYSRLKEDVLSLILAQGQIEFWRQPNYGFVCWKPMRQTNKELYEQEITHHNLLEDCGPFEHDTFDDSVFDTMRFDRYDHPRENTSRLVRHFFDHAERPILFEELVVLIARQLRLHEDQESTSRYADVQHSGKGQWVIHFIPDRQETLAKYSGFVDKMNDQTAFVTLRDEAGEVLDAKFESKRLDDQGIREGDRFTYTIEDRNGALVADFRRENKQVLSEERWREVFEKTELLFNDYDQTEAST